jgi:hypothetical protein
MVNDKFPADFVFQVLTTWGINDVVVSTAATSPIISYMSIILYQNQLNFK